MKRLLILSLFLPPLFCSANDGSFWAHGNTLFPLEETTIQLKKEVLNLTRQEGWMQVDVNFEFYNPGDEKELTVGFVTPPAMGDIAFEVEGHPQIRSFSVVIDGDSIPYQVTQTAKSGFRISNEEIGQTDFIYYFKMRFPKGITHVHHHYLYRGGEGMTAVHDYYYRLTTGTSWANKEIGDFELNIDMGSDIYFTIPYSFDTSMANWNIVGSGRLSGTQADSDFRSFRYYKSAYIRQGSIQLKQLHFKPVNDLFITVFQPDAGVGFWTTNKNENDFLNLPLVFYANDALIKKEARKLSDNQLRLLINLPYARAGYSFPGQPFLQKQFAPYIWYMSGSTTEREFKDYFYSKQIFDILTNEAKRRRLK
jgi:hypothetical protein